MNQIALSPVVRERLLQQAARLVNAGQPREALPMLEALTLRGAADAPAFGLLAEAQLRLNNADAALLAAETSLAQAPGDARLHLLRAQARRLKRDRAGALEDAAAAVMGLPEDRLARRVLATCLSEAKRHDEALFLFWGLLQEAPEDTQAALDLAMALSRAGRAEAAEEVFAATRAALAQPRGLGAPRAFNLIQSGRLQEALSVATDALADEGPSASLHAVRGQALLGLGRVAEARAALAEASRLDPGDHFCAHLGAALAGEGGGASETYTRELFDHYADYFEASLIGLRYRAPGLMLRALEAIRPGLEGGGARLGDVLDLGCGTGLAGVAVHEVLGGALVGVDLSPRMLEAARAKGIYTELHEAEVLAYLQRESRRFDVVMAADVFCYLGDLRPVIAAIAPRLAAGGHLLFTVEAGEESTPFAVTPQGRFRHARGHVEEALAAAGFRTLILREEGLRLEGGRPVEGWLAVAMAG